MRARWADKLVPTVIVSTVIASLFFGRYTDTSAHFQLETSSILIASSEETVSSAQSNSRPAATTAKVDAEQKPTVALSGLEVDENIGRGNAASSELTSLSREARSVSAEMRDNWQLSSLAPDSDDPSHRLKPPANRISEIEKSANYDAEKQILTVATAPASAFSQHAKSPAITRPPMKSRAEVQAEMADSRQVFAERTLESSSRQSAQDPADAPHVAALPAVPLASVGKCMDLPGVLKLEKSPEPSGQDQFVPFHQRADGGEFRVAQDAQANEAAEPAEQQPVDKIGTPESAVATGEQSNMTSHLGLDPKAFWWKQDLELPLVDPDKTESISLDELIMIALQNSPRILAISQEPLVEELEVVKSQSRFDPELFLRTKYDDRNDPVGNIFTTGGPSFLRDHIWTGDSGVRKKLITGGGVELKQQLGFENSNSRFFVPQDQGTATLSLNFSQPLLKGAGRMYNNSRIMLAQTSSSAAWQKYYSDLQDELLRVAEAYWRLYYFRSVLVQKQRSLQRGEEILVKLEARSGLDSLPSQIARARAAAESRRTELANAVRDVKNAETEIRKLIAQANWAGSYNIEIIPSEPPQYDHVEFPVVQVVETALEFRPEIKHSLDRAKAAAIEFDVSKNELLPELSMLFGTYVAGLEANSNIGGAWVEQFTNTTPGYYAGLEYKIPRGNRAAKSEFEQRRLQLSKIRHEVDAVVQDVIADSQIALRRVNSAHRTLQSSVAAIAAANADLRYNQSRWEAFALVEGDFAERQNATTLLDQLLEAQQRLTNEEIRFAQAELEFKNSQFYLKRAMGTLLQTDAVNSN